MASSPVPDDPFTFVAVVSEHAPVADTAESVSLAIEVEESVSVAEEPVAEEPVAEESQSPSVSSVVNTIESPAEQPTPPDQDQRFDSLGLRPQILESLSTYGYTTPTPIQAQTIPWLLEGRDVFGQAQTGTGKTAAFALPLLSRIDVNDRNVQVLVLAPTRELAIQVEESFRKYSQCMPGVETVAIYGGSDFGPQIRALRHGVQIVVGTPGRVIDHMKKGTLKVDQLQTIVLDEADEMLKMGFVDDVTWVLSQTPEHRQVALFSATLPGPIRKIAREHQKNPVEIKIKSEARTADTVQQRFIVVRPRDKMDALTRILEVEETDGVIVFVSLKASTTKLANHLNEHGHLATPLNGDIPQNLREQTVDQLKAGRIDVIVATDVAARGLDVPRISHVVNYDMPHDSESYVHRIGRTGRAGRSGQAILFARPQDKRIVRRIEKSTRQQIEQMEMPSVAEVNESRQRRFKQRINETIAAGGLDFFCQLLEEHQQKTGVSPLHMAAALAQQLQGKAPFLMEERPRRARREEEDQRDRNGRRERCERQSGDRDRHDRDRDRGDRRERRRDDRSQGSPEEGMERFRVEIGDTHGVRPGNLVGAIANEAGLDGKDIGRIQIFDEFSLVDLPEGMPKQIFQQLKNTWVSGRKLQITRDTGRPPKKRGGRPFTSGGKPPHGKSKRHGGKNRNGKPGFRRKHSSRD